MQAIKLPASAGWHWISKGLMIFLHKPAPIFAWAMTVMLLLIFASLVPPIGPLAFIVLFPTISFLSFMLCRLAIGSRTVTSATWLKILRRKGLFRQLLLLGMWYAIWNICIALGVLFGSVTDLPEATIQAALTEQNLQPLLEALHVPLIILVVLNVLLSAFLWYAPALVGFCGLSAGRAMFYSAVACWRNKKAFLVYGLMFAALYWSIAQIIDLLLLLGVSPPMLMMVQIPVHVAIASVLYCSMLPSFADVFDESPSLASESSCGNA